MLKGSKVVLREKRIEDAAADYTWKTDAELSRLDATIPLTVSFVQYSFNYAGELRHPDPQGCRFAIDTLEGKHIGNCTYYSLDGFRGEAEVGILIGDSSYWSKGYGTEAMTLQVSYLFRQMKLARLYLHTLDWNTRAQRCFTKCGFLPCGLLVRGAHNFVIMELRRSQWEMGQPSGHLAEMTSDST